MNSEEPCTILNLMAKSLYGPRLILLSRQEWQDKLIQTTWNLCKMRLKDWRWIRWFLQQNLKSSKECINLLTIWLRRMLNLLSPKTIFWNHEMNSWLNSWRLQRIWLRQKLKKSIDFERVGTEEFHEKRKKIEPTLIQSSHTQLKSLGLNQKKTF